MLHTRVSAYNAAKNVRVYSTCGSCFCRMRSPNALHLSAHYAAEHSARARQHDQDVCHTQIAAGCHAHMYTLYYTLQRCSLSLLREFAPHALCTSAAVKLVGIIAECLRAHIAMAHGELSDLHVALVTRVSRDTSNKCTLQMCTIFNLRIYVALLMGFN